MMKTAAVKETMALRNGVEMPLVGLGVMNMYGSECVRAIGVSNLNIGRLVDLSMHNRITPHVCQVEIHPFYQQTKVIQEMKNLGIQPEGWAPFAEGRNDIFHDKLLTSIGEKYGKTPAQVILRWDVQRGVAVIPKSSHPARIHENYDIWDFELTAGEMKQISSMGKGKELFFEHDSAEMARMFGSYHIH